MKLGDSNGGAGKGLIDIATAGPCCVLFHANPQYPPPEHEMPIAISEVLQKWLTLNAVRIRTTLPVVKGGNMIGLFVWWDGTDTIALPTPPAAPGAPPPRS